MELHSRRQHSDSRTAAACDATPTTYGLRFRHANTFWKAPGVYFICIKPQVHIMSEPAAIIILVQRPFSANSAETPYFGLLGRVFESNSDAS
jgi:hypothetical protein